ncbi:hypothetical protein H7F15_03270 [Pontibacter sp. Tf4]|uniref:hypothetical protein n=1 Tax=Pontibacter sp. Tf4 TaxID=2761620 RepID=UPI001628C242|nr:hypothetical protein [Pontibacter sp. Tf4]MBB6610047.1 hypothetical protein [Pontibacter sp. Tf4]
MRQREEMNYRDNDRHYSRGNNYNQYNEPYRRSEHEPGDRYRAPQDRDDWQQGRHRQEGNYHATQDDYYNAMYDIANYSGQPRHQDYGLYHGTDDELESIKPMPLQEGPYYGRQRYNYSLGYNPNYDNPEEGDMYRNFDSRGNHGYRHDASYGSVDEFRDFGDDHYGSSDYTNRGDYDDRPDRFNRY